MGDPFVVALAALGLSLGVSAIRLIDWFIHSDPKAVLKIARLAPIGIAVLAVGLLLVFMFNQQWTAAIGLAAAMVLVLAWYLPRLLRKPFRLLDPRPVEATGRVATDSITTDRELVERSVAVLEAYLRQAAPLALRSAGLQAVNGDGRNGHGRANGHDPDVDDDAMSHDEALEILGLDQGARESEIVEAHRRLVQLLHPDRGGSHYLTVKINQAKAVLIGPADARSRPARGAQPTKVPRRRSQRRQHPG
jgi:hypothetical protein